MSDQKEAAAVPEVSEAAILKQKKLEARAQKELEKSERVKAKVERKKSWGKKVAVSKVVPKRNPLKIHSKAWRKAKEQIEPEKLYKLAAAVELVKKTATTKFDASVEVHTRLTINPKKTDQAVRATTTLPAGTGRKLRIVAFVPAEQAEEAKQAGALEAGEDELIAKIAKGFLAFDVAVATPELMKKIGKIAKILGQKGLMPNPKAGTVTADFKGAIQEIQKGRVEFRNDKFGILHNAVGRVSFATEKLLENLQVYFTAVKGSKPKTVKGAFIAGVTLTSSMGPGVPVDLSSLP